MTSPRATPMVASSLTTLTGSSQPLFAAAPWDADVQEVVISNPNAAHDVWYAFDQAAVANGAGSILLAAGKTHTYQTNSAVNVIGTNADKITGYRRQEGAAAGLA